MIQVIFLEESYQHIEMYTAKMVATKIVHANDKAAHPWDDLKANVSAGRWSTV